jgi:serine protease AprX
LILFFSGISIQPVFSQEAKKYWVFFADKGQMLPSSGTLTKNSTAYKSAMKSVSSRSLERRANVLPSENLVEAADLPIYQSYIDQIMQLGGLQAHQSRWMNAVSFFLTPEQISIVGSLPFVREIKPVVTFRERKDLISNNSPIDTFEKTALLDYGHSIQQIQIINIPVLHSAGITGKGIRIGMLDTGFRWRAHEALSTRHVIAEHDFINNRDYTSNGPGDSPDQDTHGTLTFSIIGGYMPGKLVGPAYDADFILAKTEYVPVTDYYWEEDAWARAIEWMDSLGVDVVSSSLGYNTFVDTVNYTWAHGDFNGRTSVTAKAAARAARLGIIVCTSMGNEGNGDGIIGTLLTPADTDSIISVGGITFARHLWNLSSTGPTNDGRIKPDVVGPSASVYHASTPGPSTYGSSSGNSVSTPLVAGVAALILSAHPGLTPIQVRDALRATADPVDTTMYPTHPNNFVGWGLVNAFNAATSIGPIIPKIYALYQNYPNPFNSGTKIIFDLPRQEHVVIKVYNLLGQVVKTLVDDIQDAGVAKLRPPVVFDASNLPSGVYFYRLSTPSFSATKKMVYIR